MRKINYNQILYSSYVLKSITTVRSHSLFNEKMEEESFFFFLNPIENRNKVYLDNFLKALAQSRLLEVFVMRINNNIIDVFVRFVQKCQFTEFVHVSRHGRGYLEEETADLGIVVE